MTLQQLEYIVAVDETRHFVKASEKCFVTQPTLSMMIQKLEDEFGLKIFDRSQQPVSTTKEGAQLIAMARKILAKSRRMKEFAHAQKNELGGELKLGIIPTLAPYLLPRFLKAFTDACPDLHLHVREMTTSHLISAINSGEIDAGIAATPVKEDNIRELPLFYEEFVAYVSQKEKLSAKKYILPKEIRAHKLWLLEEGHCLRNQVINLCQLRSVEAGNLQYEAGSIESLIRIVDHQSGITLIPKLAELQLHHSQKKQVRTFAEPRPAREISLLVSKDYVREALLDTLKKCIREQLPTELKVQIHKSKELQRISLLERTTVA